MRLGHVEIEVNERINLVKQIREEYATIPRKSKRKGAPFRAYPLDSAESKAEKCSEVYLWNVPNLYVE